MTILAALDDSAAARPVLDIAIRMAALLGTHVEGVHVQEDGSGASAAAIAAAAHVPFHVRTGDVVVALHAEVQAHHTTALVVGTRGVPGGASPAGHIVLDLVQSATGPIVIIPPVATDRPLRSVLVAVEGDGESSALRELFAWRGDLPTPEVIVLHVIEPANLPPFADSPVLEADAFEREFMIRATGNVEADPSRVRFEMRVGEAASALRDAVRELDVDLVLIAWHCDLTGGHGRLVHEMLADAEIPLALLPLDGH